MPFLILRRWLLAAVVLPLAAGGARRVARSIEARRGGPDGLTRGLTRAADAAHRSKRDQQASGSDGRAPRKRR